MKSPSAEFAGGVFSDTIEGGRAAVRLSLSSEAASGVTRDGESFRVAFRDCELTLGGASGRMWFLKSRGPEDVTLFCEEKGFGDALALHGRRELGEQLALVLAQQSAGKKRNALNVMGALLAVALLCGGGYWGVKKAGSASVELLPPSLDRQLGDLAIDNMDLGGQVVTDPVLTQAIADIMDRLAPKQSESRFQFKPRIVDASTVNAFALPGGPMVVYTGLIRAAKTPEQLAGVLAHEMAHVTRRHGMKRLTQSLGVIAGIQLFLGDVSGVAAVAVEVFRQGAVNSYGREQEHESDMDAVQTLAKAKIDPNALAEFFEILQKDAPQLPSLVAFLGTHPELPQRVRDVRAATAKLQLSASEPLLDNWSLVQRHAGAPGMSAAEEQAPQKAEQQKDGEW